jgi:hypothetical protein
LTGVYTTELNVTGKNLLTIKPGFTKNTAENVAVVFKDHPETSVKSRGLKGSSKWLL